MKATRKPSFLPPVLYACLVLLVLSGAGKSQEGEKANEENAVVKTFQSALFQEEANRDLAGAAEGYERVIEQFEKSRKIAASALFRLAEVRRKQGKREQAIELYERLRREFPGEESLVKLSGENLVALGVEVKEVDPGSAMTPDLRDGEAKALAQAKAVFEESPDLLNHADTSGETMLTDAARHSFLEVAKFLIEHGADIDQRGTVGMTALHQAAEKGHLAMVRLLVESGASQEVSAIGGRKPIHYAVACGHPSIVNYLLDHGADAEEELELFFHYVWEGKDRYQDFQFVPDFAVADRNGSDYRTGDAEDFSDFGDLFHLAAQGKTGLIPFFLERGFPLEEKTRENEQTPLHLAIRARDDQGVMALLEAGADPTARTRDGFTPLMLAVGLGEVGMTRALLAAGANPDTVGNGGRTAVHIGAGAKTYRSDVINLLGEAGADSEVRDDQGRTPLLMAVEGGRIPNVAAMLEMGASAGVKRASDGRSALMIFFEETDRHLDSAEEIEEAFAVAEAMVVEGGADVDALDDDGDHGIDLADGREVERKVAFYLEHGATLAGVDMDAEDFVRTKVSRQVHDRDRQEIWRRMAYPELEEDGIHLVRMRSSHGEIETVLNRELLGPVPKLRFGELMTAFSEKRWPVDLSKLVVFRGKERLAVDSIDFELRPGDIVENPGSGPYRRNGLPGEGAEGSPEPAENDEEIAVFGLRRIGVAGVDGIGEEGHREFQLHPGFGGQLYDPAFRRLEARTLHEFLRVTGMDEDPFLDLGAIRVRRGGNEPFVLDAGKSNLLLLDGDHLAFPSADPVGMRKMRESGIFISRPGEGFLTRLYTRHSGSGNRYQLAQALVDFYAGAEQVLPRPDVEGIVIRRQGGGTGQEEIRIPIRISEFPSTPVHIRLVLTGALIRPLAPEERAILREQVKKRLALIVPLQSGSVREVPPRDGGSGEVGDFRIEVRATAGLPEREVLGLVADALERMNKEEGEAGIVDSWAVSSRVERVEWEHGFPPPLQLQWGDIVEIPEAKAKKDEPLPWIGFDKEAWRRLSAWASPKIETEIYGRDFSEKLPLYPPQPLFKAVSSGWKRELEGAGSTEWRSGRVLIANASALVGVELDRDRYLLHRAEPDLSIMVDTVELLEKIELQWGDRVTLMPEVD